MDKDKFNELKFIQTHWKDLGIGEIYEIKNYVVFEDLDRLRLVLKNKKRTYTLWAPDRIRYAIEGQDVTHVMSHGKKDGRWAFDVVKYEPESPLHS